MDKLIKESIQLTIKKEGYDLPEHKGTWMGYGWSIPRWYIALSGKTETGHRITQHQDGENLSSVLECLEDDIRKLYNDIKTTIVTLRKSGEKGILLDSLIDRNNWYVSFLDYLHNIK